LSTVTVNLFKNPPTADATMPTELSWTSCLGVGLILDSLLQYNNTIQFRVLARLLKKLGPQLTQPQLRPLGLHNTLQFEKLES